MTNIINIEFRKKSCVTSVSKNQSFARLVIAEIKKIQRERVQLQKDNSSGDAA